MSQPESPSVAAMDRFVVTSPGLRQARIAEKVPQGRRS